MRKCVILLLMMAMITPSILPWLPHDALHAVHDAHMAHHQSHKHNSHHHYEHNNHHQHTNAANHSIQIDVVSFFSDYLHLDLKQANNIDHETPHSTGEYFDFPTLNSISNWNIQVASFQNRGPPSDFERYSTPNSPPVYLATQRFRI